MVSIAEALVLQIQSQLFFQLFLVRRTDVNAVIFHNVVDMTNILDALKAEGH